MSLWSELRAAVQQAILVQERVERLIADVEKVGDRLVDQDRRITRIETFIAVARRRQLSSPP